MPEPPPGRVIREDRRDYRVISQLVLHHQRADEICPGGNSDAEAKLSSQLLGHEDRISIVNADNLIKPVEFKN